MTRFIARLKYQSGVALIGILFFSVTNLAFGQQRTNTLTSQQQQQTPSAPNIKPLARPPAAPVVMSVGTLRLMGNAGVAERTSSGTTLQSTNVPDRRGSRITEVERKPPSNIIEKVPPAGPVTMTVGTLHLVGR